MGTSHSGLGQTSAGPFEATWFPSLKADSPWFHKQPGGKPNFQQTVSQAARKEKDTNPMSSQGCQSESGYLKPLPPLQLTEWLPVIAVLRPESRRWQPTVLCETDDTEKVQSESAYQIRARQIAMSLLKLLEDGSTQCVNVFSGLQHHYFGAMAGTAYGAEDYKVSFSELGTGKSHVVWDLRNIVGVNGGSGLKSYNMDLFLRWYPAVKLDFRIPGQTAMVSVMAFLSHCFDDDTFGFYLNYAAFAYIVECVKRGQAMPIGGCTRTVDLVSGVRIWHVHNNASIQHCYMPGVCLKCTMGVPRKVIVQDPSRANDGPQNSRATYPFAWCFHHLSWSADKAELKASARPPFDLLTDPRFNKIAIQAGLQWTTFTGFKWSLAASCKSKLYFGVVEVGSHLGPGVQGITSLAAYNRSCPDQPLIDYYRLPVMKGRKTLSKVDFTVTDPKLLALAMRKGKKYANGDAKWALVYAATRCDHLLPEGWTTTPWRRHPSIVIHRYLPTFDAVIFDGFDKGDERFSNIDKITVNASFVPAGARVVRNGADLVEAQRAGLVPVVLQDSRPEEAMCFVHLHGGVSYLMRECIHCAMARVRILKAAVDFVVIVAYDYRQPTMQWFPQNHRFWK
ncbi:hypothetical protein B0J13DRAFT_664557 [Dactylonectria estremocensis]|uniref:Uncharacterized protein n=1 Tax=Dactylonectria estremocensis TaxID=1079267 RepID=A0A9P9EYD3_9HYPO|nr:hypothetical protein B0J13DRAFT_664557 [Dactylonectria estremocensis]